MPSGSAEVDVDYQMIVVALAVLGAAGYLLRRAFCRAAKSGCGGCHGCKHTARPCRD